MTPEKQVENQIKRTLDRYHAYYYKNWGGSFSKKGIPDIVGTYGYKNHSGKFFAIEVKRVKGGNPTPVQIQNLRHIAQNGGIAILSASADAVIALHEIVKGQKQFSVPVKTIKLRKNESITVDKAHSIWKARLSIPECQTVLIMATVQSNPI